MRQLIEDLISTMEYHVEQTRPIHSTTVALQAARDALKSLPAQEPVAWMGAHDHTDLYYRKPPQADVIPLYTSPPAQQEPVAVVSGYYGGQCVILPIDPARIFNSNTALYTSSPAQRAWEGLTDDEIAVLDVRYHRDTWRLIKESEAKLKEKNT